MDKAQFDSWLEQYSLVEGLMPDTPYERRDDAVPGDTLRVTVASDGDGFVGVKGSDRVAEFCTSGTMGGGQSMRVLRAVWILATAIMFDNEDKPL